MFRSQFWLACLLALSLGFGMVGCTAEEGGNTGGDAAPATENGATDGADEGSGA